MNLAIVDYGGGNIRSVINAVERLGVTPVLTDDAEVIAKADKVLFPGQGEAASAMRALHEKKLDKVICGLHQPVLGICIGQQLMCAHSEEGDVDCLGIFDVTVRRFVPMRHEDKVPHMGWNQIKLTQDTALLDGLDGSFVYYVHSYYVPVMEHTIATTDYVTTFSAAVNRNNFYATQFHPEKSGDVGETILRNFIEKI